MGKSAAVQALVDVALERRAVVEQLGPENYFRFPDDGCSINNTSAWWLLVCGPGKQQQIPIRIFDDEILGAPRLLFQCLAKGNPSGLKFKKQ